MSQRTEYWLGQIGKEWRARHEPITEEPLPKRWVELLRYLDEKERRLKQTRASDSDAPTTDHPRPTSGD